MKIISVRFLAALGLILLSVCLFAQQTSISRTDTVPQKYALVIGNGAYVGLTQLANPVNDANDVAAALESLGFTVDKVLNGTLQQMEDAAVLLKNRLSDAGRAYGFFFYAGHGVQSNGENYLIPVDADIPTENYLRSRAVSVQALLDDLNDARNGLNVVVLDACRDSPFGWNRSTGRGLAIITSQPADSIIVYSTSAGKQASDGTGRNGLFTSQLLLNLTTPGIEVKEIFNLTGADVAQVSQRQQIPAIYSQFFGTAYLGTLPDGTSAYVPGAVHPVTQPYPVSGAETPARDETKLWSVGVSAGTSFYDPWAVATIRGTVAPFQYQFLEAGLDAGFVTTMQGTDSYYSLCPYIHYSFFMPISGFGGWYLGGGGSYRYNQYRFGSMSVNTNSGAALDLSAGALLFNFLDVSYTFRTDFSSVHNKLSAGYAYRF